ncbi:MAG: ATP-dependent helicase, partial [Chloroflexi bacterium]
MNRQQQEAVEAQGHTAIIAGPGMGKTFTITKRAQKMLQAGQSVCMVTFTRESAREMQVRIGNVDRSKFICGTFHALAANQLAESLRVRIMRAGLENFVLRRAFEQAGEEDDELFREIAKEVRDYLAGHKGRSSLSDVASDTWECAKHIMLKERAIAIEAICALAAELIEQGKLPLLNCQQMIVDEFQDVDRHQLQWILSHAEGGVTITVVGDDDQSIYGFRGSLGTKAFRVLMNRLSPCVIKLSINYRSHSEITNLASGLIEHNKQRIKKSIKAHRGAGGRISTAIYPDFKAETNDL